MTSDSKPVSARVRIGLSVLIGTHLLAVFLPPLSLQTRGPLGQSPAVSTLLRPVEGYTQFLYIDRGYAFFAPDPGPSHLVQAAITDGSGEMAEVMFPDREKQWPRLLYHRHFMLTEFLDEIYFPPGPPPELTEVDPVEAEIWVRQRARYEHVRQSYIEHLKHVNPGKDIAVRRIEHLIPGILDYQREPIALNDSRLYQVIPDEPIRLGGDEDLAAPLGPPETIPPPSGTAMEREKVSDVEERDSRETELETTTSDLEKDNSDETGSENPAAVDDSSQEEVSGSSSGVESGDQSDAQEETP